MTVQQLILASASPRRREILTLAGLPFEICPAVEETAPVDLPPAAYTLELAKSKATAVAKTHPGRFVVGADTIVAVDGRVLGKPATPDAAVEMLMSLQGRTHTVMTGVFVCSPGRCDGFTDCTDVCFYPFTHAEATAYVATGEPMDKAGAYGIQGYGMRFVKGIAGDFYTVMGLPGARLRRFLETFPDF